VLEQFGVVTPDYFATLPIPLLAGEICREHSNPNGVMVSGSFANSYLGIVSSIVLTGDPRSATRPDAGLTPGVSS
jgi:hypothetical protein